MADFKSGPRAHLDEWVAPDIADELGLCMVFGPDSAGRSPGGPMSEPIYALNLFNIADKDEYLAYSRRSAKEVQAHGGRVVALGRFRAAATGDIEPRAVLILVEWASMEAFESYRNDPKLADLHPHRVNGTEDYVWHLFDKLADLRPLLK